MRRDKPWSSTAGFTLVELLVVVAVIAILVAALIPAVNSARESARRTTCQNNMRNFGLAIVQYEAARGFYPPACTTQDSEAPGIQRRPGNSQQSAITYLLPYFEQQVEYDLLDLQRNWDFGPNADVTKRINLGGILHCPSAPFERKTKQFGNLVTLNVLDAQLCDYAPVMRFASENNAVASLINNGAIANRGAPDDEKWQGILQEFENRKQARISSDDVRDGLSRTLVFYECAGRPQKYQQGRPVTDWTMTSYRWASTTLPLTVNDPCPGGQFVNCHNSDEVYGIHKRGAAVARADGSTVFLSADIDPDVFVALYTMAAGDSAGDSEL